MQRLDDQTGVSRTGRVLEGVLWQNGEVTVQWRPPHCTYGHYHSLEEFKIIHVDCHPSCNEIVWIDEEIPPPRTVKPQPLFNPSLLGL